MLQLAVSWAAAYEAPRRSSTAGSTPFDTRWFGDLLARVQRAADSEAACLIVAEALAEATGADHAAVGLLPVGARTPRRGAGSMTLRALSGVTEFDRRSDLVRALEGALSAATRRDGMTVWTSQDGEADPDVAAAGRELQSREVWSMPVCGTGGTSGAVVLLFTDQQAPADPERAGEEAPARFAAGVTVLADALDLLRRGEARFAAADSGLSRTARAVLLAGLLLAVGAAMLYPVDHKLTAGAVVEPELRRFVVAPFEGVLEQSEVSPGDVVAVDDLLVTLDGRELELERVRLGAERDKLVKQRDVSLASGETAATQIAELELQRIAASLDLLAYKRRNLEIRSPVDGVIISGDLSRQHGSPVSTGERLFELAPVDRMVAEIEVPADEVAYFEDGASAVLTLDALPERALTAEVQRLHPRAEVRSGQSVFVAEMDLDNVDGALRPGMRGTASIVVGERPLGWVLFHRAWEKVITWLR